MLRKILVSFLVIVFLGVYAHAEETGNDHGYNEVKLHSDFEFRALYQDNVVYMDWEKFSVDEELRYYKIVRSTKNSNPVYPEDGHIKYSSDGDFIEHTDKWPPSGDVYYRVCAITLEKNRYCSKVVKIEVKKETKQESGICTMEYAPVCGEYKHACCSANNNPSCYNKKVSCNAQVKTYSNKCVMKNAGATYKYSGACSEENPTTVTPYSVSSKLKLRAKALVNTLLQKLEKRGLSDSQIIDKIDNLVKKLNLLEKEKPRLSNIINYLIELLKEKRGEYEDGFDDIEDIFSDF